MVGSSEKRLRSPADRGKNWSVDPAWPPGGYRRKGQNSMKTHKLLKACQWGPTGEKGLLPCPILPTGKPFFVWAPK